MEFHFQIQIFRIFSRIKYCQRLNNLSLVPNLFDHNCFNPRMTEINRIRLHNPTQENPLASEEQLKGFNWALGQFGMPRKLYTKFVTSVIEGC